MDRIGLKQRRLARRIRRVKFGLQLESGRSRLVFKKSNRYLLAQIIDDTTGNVLCQASTFEKSFEAAKGSKKNRESAKQLGKIIAERAKAKGVSAVLFDRRGRLYHGKVADFADQAREAGLEF